MFVNVGVCCVVVTLLIDLDLRMTQANASLADERATIYPHASIVIHQCKAINAARHAKRCRGCLQYGGHVAETRGGDPGMQE